MSAEDGDFGQLLREDIARLILAEQVECSDHPPGLPKPSCWTCGRNGALARAARIALGRHPATGDVAAPAPVRIGWHGLPFRKAGRRRAAIETLVASVAETAPNADTGAAGSDTWTAEVLSLPSGTVLTAADHGALVTRFTAHAGVLVRNGLCPLHEAPLMSKAGGGDRHGWCTKCGRDWFPGPVTPYEIAGMKVTGGEPLQRDDGLPAGGRSLLSAGQDVAASDSGQVVRRSNIRTCGRADTPRDMSARRLRQAW